MCYVYTTKWRWKQENKEDGIRRKNKEDGADRFSQSHAHVFHLIVIEHRAPETISLTVNTHKLMQCLSHIMCREKFINVSSSLNKTLICLFLLVIITTNIVIVITIIFISLDIFMTFAYEVVKMRIQNEMMVLKFKFFAMSVKKIPLIQVNINKNKHFHVDQFYKCHLNIPLFKKTTIHRNKNR